MDNQQKELINDYFRLEKNIKYKKRKLENVKRNFYSQNFCGTTNYDDPIGLSRRGFTVEREVAAFVDYVETIEEGIHKLKRKNKHFNSLLRSLEQNTYMSLKRRYKTDSFEIDSIQTMANDIKIIDEILEIEEAVRFEFGDKKFYEYTQTGADGSEKLTIIADENEAPSQLDLKAMKVENMEFRDDNSEDAFEAMTDLLGV